MDTRFKRCVMKGLQGCSDQHLFQVCCAERYCLVTLDLDFSDVTRFPPGDANGVVVIRVPQNPRLELPEQLVRQCLEALSRGPLEERLWVVEVNRIRVQPDRS